MFSSRVEISQFAMFPRSELGINLSMGASISFQKKKWKNSLKVNLLLKDFFIPGTAQESLLIDPQDIACGLVIVLPVS